MKKSKLLLTLLAACLLALPAMATDGTATIINLGFPPNNPNSNGNPGVGIPPGLANGAPNGIAYGLTDQGEFVVLYLNQFNKAVHAGDVVYYKNKVKGGGDDIIIGAVTGVVE